MGDDNELGLLAQIPQIGRKPLHIPVVQRRVDLVENAEGRRPYLQNGEIQSGSHEGLLAARQQRDGLQLLSGGLHPDLDAAGQRLLRIFQHQLTLAAAKHFLKDDTKVMVDLLELFHEDGGHFLGDTTDNALQLPLGVQHILLLLGKITVALVDTGVLLDRAQIRRAQHGDLSLQFRDFPLTGSGRLNHAPLFSGGAGGQLVGIPQLVNDLFFLHGRGLPFLLQIGAGTFLGQDILAHFLCFPLGSGLGSLRGSPIGHHRLQGGLLLRDLVVVFLLASLQGGNLALDADRICPEGFDQRLLLLPVAFHSAAQGFQIGHMGQSRSLLRLPGGRFRLQRRHGLRNFRRCGVCLRLTFLQFGKFPAGVGKLLTIHLDLCLGGRITLPVGSVPGLEGLHFPAGRVTGILNGLNQDLVLLFLAFQPQASVFRLTQLLVGGVQLEIHLIHQPLSFLQLTFRHQLFIL